MSANLRAIAIVDPPFEDEEDDFKFYVLEGTCKKCLLGPNTLVIYDFKANAKNRSQSIFKTQCIACGHRDMHYSATVQKGEL